MDSIVYTSFNLLVLSLIIYLLTGFIKEQIKLANGYSNRNIATSQKAASRTSHFLTKGQAALMKRLMD